MAESTQVKNKDPAQRPTTEKHGIEPPNVTIDEMMDNLSEYLNKRLGLRKCHDDMCQKYGIKQSNSGLWDLQDIKKAYGKTNRLRSCMQKTGESVVEYEERFRQIWLEHAGLNGNEDLDKDTNMPLKTAFVNGLKPEISKALKIRYDDWDGIGTAFNQIVEWSVKIERTYEVKLRALQSRPSTYSYKSTENDLQEKGGRRYTQTKTQRQGRCNYCNKEGHWFRECKIRLRYENKDVNDLDKRFQQLTQEQKQSLLNAVEPQGN
ncbi:uncharacterized protein LOC131531565 [Onychostoma macrolepis]|uniref:uncharacterized protein LOC131531565 n=1 Tax=Onychostoma macrolepis TaxID=369639 RepID=UPI00272D6C9C|nr:uncharacterized protein LOC131531565 [Onychostoma macrolepis]